MILPAEFFDSLLSNCISCSSTPNTGRPVLGVHIICQGSLTAPLRGKLMSQLNWEQLAGVNLEYRLYPFEYFLAAQQRLGIRTIELWGGAPHFLLGYDEVQDCTALRRQVERFGLTVGAFAPECVTYPFPMCSGVPHIRQKALGYYSNAIHAATELGASVVPLSCAGTLKDEDPALGFERAVEMLRVLADEAKKAGVILAVATLSPDVSCILNTLDELERLLKAVDSPNVKACLDVCAVRTAGETLDQWFDTFGAENIIHAHFQDGCQIKINNTKNLKQLSL